MKNKITQIVRKAIKTISKEVEHPNITKKEETIYSLDINESLTIEGYLVTRVPGGWLYKAYREYWDDEAGFYKREGWNVIFIPYI